MTKRILAMTLCLVLTLLACACAASNATVSAPEQSENKGGNTPPASTIEQPGTSLPVMQMSSQPAPSDEESKPTEPILPEEKETTLEKVLSFDIGMDGLLPYYLLSPPDDIDPPMLNIMGSLYTDGKGTFYHTQENRILCINDGTWLPVFHSDQILDIEICEKDFYVLTTHGTVYCYDISLGFEQATLSDTYTVFDGVGADDGELCCFRESVPLFHSDTGVFYTLDKKQLSREEAPFHKEQSDTELSVLSQNGSFVITGKDAERYEVYTVSSENIGLLEWDLDTGNCICTAYSRSGEISTRFLYAIGSTSNMQDCLIQVKYGKDTVSIKEHLRRRASVGAHAFEGLLSSSLFFSADGGAYFAAYYADRCDIYRVNSGYSDVHFSDSSDTEERSIAPTSSTSESSASSVIFLEVSSAFAKTKALAMINLPWTIHDGNLDARPNTELPHYLDVNYYPEGYVIPENQTGIPYCRGRYNTGETFVTDAGTIHSNGKCYMAGNIAPGNIQPQTVGLDCMRFLCASFDFEEGLAPWQFIEDYLDIGYGHRIYSANDLHEMDVIIRGSHAMFFSKIENGTVWVYDTMSKIDIAKTQQRNTYFTFDQLKNDYNYRFYHVYSKIKHNATQHWEQCESCGGYQQNYENHTMLYEYNIQNHWGNCTGCDYQLGTTSHTISTSYLYNTTHHWRGCTANCGKKSHNALHNTSNFGACSVCGYNPNVLNTRPGTEVVLEQ